MQTEAVILKDEELPPLQSPHTPLYAASVTCGGELTEKGFLHAVGVPRDGKPDQVTVWLLKNKKIIFSPFAGETITQKEFQDRWNDHAWLSANPDHPITFMRFFLANLQNARDFLIKHKPLIMERNGRRTAFIPQDAREEEKAKIREELWKGSR